MTRAEALRKIINDCMDVHFVTKKGVIISGDDLIDIYDKLSEDITIAEEKPEKAKPKKRRKPKVDLDVGKMMALFKAGWSYKAIADEIGCSASTAYNKITEVLHNES